MIRNRPITLALIAAALATFGGSAWSDTPPSVPASKQRVLVLPFIMLNGKADQAWMSKGIQDNTVAELGRSPYLMPVAYSGTAQPNADPAIAARLGKGAGMPFALYGSAQLVGENVRITAQLVNSNTGESIATAASTGPASDLLKLEDEIVTQLRQPATGAPAVAAAGTVGAPKTATPTTPPATASNVVVVNPPPQPQVIVVQQGAPDLSLANQMQAQQINTPQYTGYPYTSGYGYGYPGSYPYPVYNPYAGYNGPPVLSGPMYGLVGSSGPQVNNVSSNWSPGIVNWSATTHVTTGHH